MKLHIAWAFLVFISMKGMDMPSHREKALLVDQMVAIKQRNNPTFDKRAALEKAFDSFESVSNDTIHKLSTSDPLSVLVKNKNHKERTLLRLLSVIQANAPLIRRFFDHKQISPHSWIAQSMLLEAANNRALANAEVLLSLGVTPNVESYYFFSNRYSYFRKKISPPTKSHPLVAAINQNSIKLPNLEMIHMLLKRKNQTDFIHFVGPLALIVVINQYPSDFCSQSHTNEVINLLLQEGADPFAQISVTEPYVNTPMVTSPINYAKKRSLDVVMSLFNNHMKQV